MKEVGQALAIHYSRRSVAIKLDCRDKKSISDTRRLSSYISRGRTPASGGCENTLNSSSEFYELVLIDFFVGEGMLKIGKENSIQIPSKSLSCADFVAGSKATCDRRASTGRKGEELCN